MFYSKYKKIIDVLTHTLHECSRTKTSTGQTRGRLQRMVKHLYSPEKNKKRIYSPKMKSVLKEHQQASTCLVDIIFFWLDIKNAPADQIERYTELLLRDLGRMVQSFDVVLSGSTDNYLCQIESFFLFNHFSDKPSIFLQRVERKKERLHCIISPAPCNYCSLTQFPVVHKVSSHHKVHKVKMTVIDKFD